jgi:hypothetical protein
LKRLLDTWDRNESTSGPTPWQIYNDDDDDDDENMPQPKELITRAHNRWSRKGNKFENCWNFNLITTPDKGIPLPLFGTQLSKQVYKANVRIFNFPWC